MELKPGYQQTEVGVIPENWEVKTLQDLCKEEISYGIVQCGPHVEGGIPYIRVSDMEGPVLNRDRMLCTSIQIASRFRRSEVRHGDIVYALRGRLGDVRVVPAELDGANLTQGTARISPSNIVQSTFLFWALQNPEVVLRACSESKGTTFMEITLSDLRQIKLALPPQIEQSRISLILSDFEESLTALDLEIEKKRNVKQAAMQELLTGKRRLPGFAGEWETIRLGDHVKYLKNGTNPRAELRADGRVKYLHYGDVHASSRSFASPNDLPSLPVSKAAGLDRLKDGDLIFADASEDITGVSKSVEIHDSRESEVVSGLHTIAARFEKSVLADGFKGFLQYIPSFSEHLRRLAAGTKVYATNKAHISSAEVQLPPVSEQRAIAGVLSEMDAELAALEARRDKTRELKQGMMQELLTGRIRLQ
jgi:type I restriction enzyme S subunit